MSWWRGAAAPAATTGTRRYSGQASSPPYPPAPGSKQVQHTVHSIAGRGGGDPDLKVLYYKDPDFKDPDLKEPDHNVPDHKDPDLKVPHPKDTNLCAEFNILK